MGDVLSRFSFATATAIQQLKNSSNREKTVKSTTFWLSVWKNCQKNQNYEPIQLNTLLERFYAESKNKHGETSHKTIQFHRKWFGYRLNNSLNCLARLWTFLRLIDVKISLSITVLIVRGCFDWMHLMRALCFCVIMISYLEFFHVHYYT